MSVRLEVANGLTFRFSSDVMPSAADRMQAMVLGHFVDELTGKGLGSPLRVTTTTSELSGRAVGDGVAGLIGNPARRFPGLASGAVTVDMTVSARRYLARPFEVTLGPINTGAGAPADFPAYFAPADLGVTGLHRMATVLRGRVVQAGVAPRVPLAGVTVEVTGLWHRFPSPSDDVLLTVEAADIAALRPGLYQPRTLASQVRRRVLAAVAGEDKVLLRSAEAGAVKVQLSDRINLNPGDVLALQAGHSELAEYIAVTSVDGATDPAHPAWLTLAHPLAHLHRVGASAVRVLPQAPGTDNLLARDAGAGDEMLFLAALADLDDGTTVEIDGGAAPEYHRLSRYRTLSDAEGFYVLPPLARMAQVQLRVSRADLPQPLERVYSPDYDLPENTVNFIL